MGKRRIIVLVMAGIFVLIGLVSWGVWESFHPFKNVPTASLLDELNDIEEGPHADKVINALVQRIERGELSQEDIQLFITSLVHVEHRMFSHVRKGGTGPVFESYISTALPFFMTYSTTTLLDGKAVEELSGGSAPKGSPRSSDTNWVRFRRACQRRGHHYLLPYGPKALGTHTVEVQVDIQVNNGIQGMLWRGTIKTVKGNFDIVPELPQIRPKPVSAAEDKMPTFQPYFNWGKAGFKNPIEGYLLRLHYRGPVAVPMAYRVLVNGREIRRDIKVPVLPFWSDKINSLGVFQPGEKVTVTLEPALDLANNQRFESYWKKRHVFNLVAPAQPGSH